MSVDYKEGKTFIPPSVLMENVAYQREKDLEEAKNHARKNINTWLMNTLLTGKVGNTYNYTMESRWTPQVILEEFVTPLRALGYDVDQNNQTIIFKNMDKIV